jgi:hypothetical protein
MLPLILTLKLCYFFNYVYFRRFGTLAPVIFFFCNACTVNLVNFLKDVNYTLLYLKLYCSS